MRVVDALESFSDGSLCGLAIKRKNAFNVRYLPGASPGAWGSFYLFEKFVGVIG